MSGGWSTVDAPTVGSLGSYGAYSGSSPGVVTYSAGPGSVGDPGVDSFSYRVYDGTTYSDQGSVTILFVP